MFKEVGGFLSSSAKSEMLSMSLFAERIRGNRVAINISPPCGDDSVHVLQPPQLFYRQQNVAVIMRFVARVVGRDDSQNVVTGGQLRSVPGSGLSPSVSYGVGYIVEKSGGGAAIDRDPALFCVRDLWRILLRRKTIEHKIDPRLVESGSRRAVRSQNLVAETVETKAPPARVH